MITPPPLIDVTPGDPISSEQWNNVLQALRNVYEALNKSFGLLSINVRNQVNGNPIPDAIVTLIPTNDDGRPVRSAQFAGGTINRYQVPQLVPGAYNMIVEALGFRTEQREITVEASGTQEVVIDMTALEVLSRMPNLFGRLLNEAMDIITRIQLQTGRIIDSHGAEIAPGNVPADKRQLVVLSQVPETGAPVARNTPVQLHVSAKAEFTEKVRVPDLRGLTLEEAKAKLEANRLALGRTGSVSK
jgi:hypothetical protein